MLRNYFIIAIRHFSRHRLFSLINVLCLSIGITFTMVIGVYVLNQENVNSNLRNAGNQYFLKSKWKQKDLGSDITTISPLAKTLHEEYPNLVANYYRYNPVTNVVSAGERHFKEDIAIGDTTLVSMYGFPLLYGDKAKAFTDNSSAVITETFAMKLFGTKDAIGKRLSIQTTATGINQDYIVSAVLKDIPYNSVTHLLKDSYSVYIPTAGSRYYQIGDPSLGWDNLNELSFVELKPGLNAASIQLPLNSLIRKYSSDFIWKNLGTEAVDVKGYYLKDNNGAVQKMIVILSVIALFILVMVIINFVNINIGTSSYRLKEIGLRKTFGSGKKQIILQFIVEALMLTFIASLVSVLLYQLLIPVFSNVLNTSMQPVWLFDFREYLLLFLFVVLVGFLAGFYPAFVLSATDLVHAVKGKINGSKKGLTLRRALLVVQFSLAILVFICALNISKQVSYIFSKDLGYSKDQLLVVNAFPKQWDSAGVLKMETIRQGLLQLPAVKNASLTFDLPESTPYGRIILYPPAGSGIRTQLNLPVSVADEDFAKTFGIQMKAGSFFGNSTDGIVLNETAVKQLGLTNETAVGKQINTPIAGAPVTIAGVMKDFNFSTMQDAIGPIGYTHVKTQNIFRFMAVKIGPGNTSKAIADIKNQWKALAPNAPFDYTFMDEKFGALYKSELQLETASNVATVLNLVIVLLGIIGVIAFTINKRLKEIAVRKVLGARATSIVLLFVREYAVLILIANIIAWPLAYIVSEHFLQNFVYRIRQNISQYVLVLVLTSVIAFSLIWLQCIKAAIANPVKNLRTE